MDLQFTYMYYPKDDIYNNYFTWKWALSLTKQFRKNL